MTIAFINFWEELLHNEILAVTVCLMIAVIVVNGWTDAPNAIATCIGTKALSPKAALLLAIVFNFLGVFIMTLINATVAQTIYELVDFGGQEQKALIALLAALLAIVMWATLAWSFGIPTSESHALIAGISGAAIALQGFAGINGGAWAKVLYGLFLSTFFGFVLGYWLTKILRALFKRVHRQKAENIFRKGQIVSAAGMAFMHGAQDGQKFLGVFMLGIVLAQGGGVHSFFKIPLWLMLICSLALALGTSFGGFRIIKSVGLDMVDLAQHQAFATDLAAGACLLFSSLSGVPVSTTHTKTSALLGAGSALRFRSVNLRLAKGMIITWLLTFPGCGALGFCLAKLLIHIC